MTANGIRTRVAHPPEPNLSPAEEVARWKGAESPLLDAERQGHLSCIRGGVASVTRRLTQGKENRRPLQRAGASTMMVGAGSSGASSKGTCPVWSPFMQPNLPSFTRHLTSPGRAAFRRSDKERRSKL